MTITLVYMPGDGAREVTLSQGATLADLVAHQGIDLKQRSMFVNGRGISNDSLATTTLHAGDEVFANGTVKGA